MATPDATKLEIAAQMKSNITEVPKELRNNYRSMTGDELEPGKPTIIDSDGDAYVRRMME